MPCAGARRAPKCGAFSSTGSCPSNLYKNQVEQPSPEIRRTRASTRFPSTFVTRKSPQPESILDVIRHQTVPRLVWRRLGLRPDEAGRNVHENRPFRNSRGISEIRIEFRL